MGSQSKHVCLQERHMDIKLIFVEQSLELVLHSQSPHPPSDPFSPGLPRLSSACSRASNISKTRMYFVQFNQGLYILVEVQLFERVRCVTNIIDNYPTLHIPLSLRKKSRITRVSRPEIGHLFY
jgi:hypothetical protein